MKARERAKALSLSLVFSDLTNREKCKIINVGSLWKILS